MAKIIGNALPNIPWQDPPETLRTPLWRFDGNPIIGRDGDAEITMDEMAALRGTINYEVACGFGMRLEKVYV